MRSQFIEGMSHVACTVNVVTTDGPYGRAGLTVSSMCSLSADPPSLLICVNHTSRSCRIMEKNAVFCVNVLKECQSDVAEVFAGRRGENSLSDKFSCARWDVLATGAPVLDEALVAFDCRLAGQIRHGTHVVYLGELVDVRRESSRNPLIYANRAYGIALSHTALPRKSGGNTGRAETVRAGCFSPLGSYLMPALARTFSNKRRDCLVEIQEGCREDLTRRLESRDLDLVITYDVALPDGLKKEKLAETQPYILLPSGHPLAKQRAVSLTSLAPEPLVLLDLPPTAEYIESTFAEQGLSPTIGYTSASFEMVRGMVGHGFGYSLLMTKPANNMTYDGAALVTRSLKEQISARSVIAAYRGSLNPSARAFLQHCHERLVAPSPAM